MTPARAERGYLADTLLEYGPDAPTLCHPWTARDLAAHLIVRERRPDAAPGILLKRLAGYTGKVQARVAAGDWGELVEQVRNGPPVWAPTRIEAVDRLANTAEFFVHHEDVLRAGVEWEPRVLAADLVDDLYAPLKRAKMLVKSAPVGIVLDPTDGHDPITANDGPRAVTVRGPVPELVLWAFGRQAHAVVEYDGPADAVETVKSASFGI